MKYLKNYKKYTESIQIDVSMDYKYSDIMESLSIFHDKLLSSINAEEIDLQSEFKFKLTSSVLDLNLLSENSDFMKAIGNKGLVGSIVENTDDYETFINRSMKFMNIRKSDSNELSNPQYIIIQNFDVDKNTWGKLKLYKVRDNISKFYNALSSKTIELIYKGNNYIYSTSNSGNEWSLKNIKDANDNFKKYLRKEDLKSLISNTKDMKITII